MITLWGLRLGVYLLFTRVFGHPEEGGYVAPEKSGDQYPLKFLLFR